MEAPFSQPSLTRPQPPFIHRFFSKYSPSLSNSAASFIPFHFPQNYSIMFSPFGLIMLLFYMLIFCGWYVDASSRRIPDSEIQTDMRAVDLAFKSMDSFQFTINHIVSGEENLTDAQKALFKRNWELETMQTSKPVELTQFNVEMLTEALELTVELDQQRKGVWLGMEKLAEWADQQCSSKPNATAEKTTGADIGGIKVGGGEKKPNGSATESGQPMRVPAASKGVAVIGERKNEDEKKVDHEDVIEGMEVKGSGAKNDKQQQLGKLAPQNEQMPDVIELGNGIVLVKQNAIENERKDTPHIDIRKEQNKLITKFPAKAEAKVMIAMEKGNDGEGIWRKLENKVQKENQPISNSNGTIFITSANNPIANSPFLSKTMVEKVLPQAVDNSERTREREDDEGKVLAQIIKEMGAQRPVQRDVKPIMFLDLSDPGNKFAGRIGQMRQQEDEEEEEEEDESEDESEEPRKLDGYGPLNPLAKLLFGRRKKRQVSVTTEENKGNGKKTIKMAKSFTGKMTLENGKNLDFTEKWEVQMDVDEKEKVDQQKTGANEQTKKNDGKLLDLTKDIESKKNLIVESEQKQFKAPENKPAELKKTETDSSVLKQISGNKNETDLKEKAMGNNTSGPVKGLLQLLGLKPTREKEDQQKMKENEKIEAENKKNVVGVQNKILEDTPEDRARLKEYLEGYVARTGGKKRDLKLAYVWYSELLYWLAKQIEAEYGPAEGQNAAKVLDTKNGKELELIRKQWAKTVVKLAKLEEWIGKADFRRRK